MGQVKEKVGEWREYILLLLAVFNIIGIAIAAYITIRLAPLERNVAVLAQSLEENERKDGVEHKTFITKDTFEQINTRLNSISNRVDSIYHIVATRD